MLEAGRVHQHPYDYYELQSRRPRVAGEKLVLLWQTLVRADALVFDPSEETPLAELGR